MDPVRTLVPLALTLLLAGCLAPGERDPTRYPWDQPRPKGSFCIVSLEMPDSTGITVGGQNTVHMACNPPLSDGQKDPSRE